MHLFSRVMATSALTTLIFGSALAQKKPSPPTPPTPAPAPAPSQKGAPTTPPTKPPANPFGKPGPKPYEEVVTKEAKTQVGLFKVHQIDDRVLFEIPKELLNRDLDLIATLIRLPNITSFEAPGVPAVDSVIFFEKHNDTLYLRAPDYSVRTAKDDRLAEGLRLVDVPPILQSYDILAYSPTGDPVIEVTRLYNSDPQDFSVRNAVRGIGVDPTRSFIDHIKAYPNNIEEESQLTFITPPGFRGGASAATTTIHYSLALLPKTPMQPRLKDSRIGYFSDYFTLYSGDKLESKTIGYINRFRLEKKDVKAAVSDPVKPIVFTIGREVPDKWRPYIKQAVANWQPAFLAAGFSNAIYAVDAPTLKEDPNWDSGDVRYNVISWNPSTIANAEGLHLTDPRSGETLAGHVVVWNEVLKLSQDWYFAQASASDPKARVLPLPDDTIGHILTYILTHEVGHVLGLEHNFKASSTYTIAQLRDPAWTNKWGDEASIMDYGRFNYVAQPGDGAALIPKLGPYDYFAIKYGYMPPLSPTTEGEKPGLDQYLAQQVNDKTLQFNNSDFTDPGVETEDIGNDPVQATALGLKNIDRISGFLLSATTQEQGEDYSELANAYDQLVNQRFIELIHTSRLVGGVVNTDYHVGHGGAVYAPVPKAQQAAAVALIVDKGLNFPAALENSKVLDKIRPSGDLNAVGSIQQSLLTTLLTESRVQRMFDNEATHGSAAYRVEDMINDIQASVWGELHQKAPVISIYRRALQRRYLEVMNTRLNGPGASTSEFRPLARLALMRLNSGVAVGLKTVSDPMTRAHLLDIKNQIKSILENKNGNSGPITLSLGSLFGIKDRSFCSYPVPFHVEGLEP